jgi:hypothetical protein
LPVPLLSAELSSWFSPEMLTSPWPSSETFASLIDEEVLDFEREELHLICLLLLTLPSASYDVRKTRPSGRTSTPTNQRNFMVPPRGR